MMEILVDTSIWSLAFRRKAAPFIPPEILELKQLILECRARIIGPIRQELLSGISHDDQYDSLCNKLRAFPDIPLETGHFERAAKMSGGFYGRINLIKLRCFHSRHQTGRKKSTTF